MVLFAFTPTVQLSGSAHGPVASGSLPAGGHRLGDGGSGEALPRPRQDRLGTWLAGAALQADGHGARERRAVQGWQQAPVPEDRVS